jgi:hypothetical protein
MKEIIISQEDILDMNIRLARDLVVQANTTPYKEEKIKALFMASQIIEKSLINEGIDPQKTKVKKQK